MSKDTDSNQIVVRSKARRGLKREFANAMKAQTKIHGSHGRTRPNKRPKKAGSFNVDPNSSMKKNKEEEVEDEEPRTGFSTGTTSTSKKLHSWNVKNLLASGILEGMAVNYGPCMKAKKTGDNRLQGVIRGKGIECSCENCNKDKIVGATTFELHAGSGNKRPTEYIKLGNGKTLREVLKTWSNTPLANLEEAVQNVLSGLTVHKSTFCFHCKGSFEDVNVVSKLLCNSCTTLKDYKSSPTQKTENNNTCVSPAVQSRDLQSHKSVFEEGVLDIVEADIAYFLSLMRWV